ncbi:MAG: hypothetical protein IT364_22980 [Candidatus Hydrogenedentes bacterium]|nr:hypothetical protein [Candidatus Hydrogenedentota bacterium]
MDADDVIYVFENVRERFDIEFDSYAEETGTVGDLYKYILWKLGLRQREEACLCPPTFFALRQALATQTGRDAKSITLDTRLQDLLPWWRRRGMWRRLSGDMKVEFPELVDPPGATLLGAILWLVAGIPLTFLVVYVLIVRHTHDPGSMSAWLLGLVLQVPIWLILVRLSRLFQRRLPYGCRTVGGLVKQLVAFNPNRIRARFNLHGLGTRPARLDSAQSTHCCTNLAVFLRVRRALIETTGYYPTPIHTDTPLAEVMGQRDRRSTWNMLRRNLGWELPNLERSWLVFGLCTVVVVAAMAMWIRDIDALFLVVVLAYPYGFLAWVCTIPFAVHFPKDCKTVGGLAQAVTKLNYGRIAKENNSLHPDEVWPVLCDLVAEAASTCPENVTKDMPLWDSARAV